MGCMGLILKWLGIAALITGAIQVAAKIIDGTLAPWGTACFIGAIASAVVIWVIHGEDAP